MQNARSYVSFSGEGSLVSFEFLFKIFSDTSVAQCDSAPGYFTDLLTIFAVCSICPTVWTHRDKVSIWVPVLCIINSTEEVMFHHAVGLMGGLFVYRITQNCVKDFK